MWLRKDDALTPMTYQTELTKKERAITELP
jgi:hypothetical protein